MQLMSFVPSAAPAIVGENPLPEGKSLLLTIGHRQTASFIHSILGNQPHIEIMSSISPGRPNIYWERDLQVVLLDGTHLNPHPIVDHASRIAELVGNTYPVNQNRSYGTGLLENRESPVIGPEVCIEGGNVKFFEHQGVVGAFIGASSVIHTAKRMALVGLLKEMPEENFEELTPKSIQSLQSTAHEEVLQYIADALKIARPNLIVLEHMRVHIDLEILVGSEGKLFLHDPEEAGVSLKYVEGKCSRQEWLRHSARFEAERKSINAYKQAGIFDRNKALLESYGFQVIGVPGYHDFSTVREGGQLVNGLLLRDESKGKEILLTTSSTLGIKFEHQELVHSHFRNSASREPDSISHLLSECFFLKMKNKGVDVIFVNHGGARGGGIHCLTREDRFSLGKGDLPHLLPVDFDLIPKVIPTELQVGMANAAKCHYLAIKELGGDGPSRSVELKFDEDLKVFRGMVDVPLGGDLGGLLYHFVVNNEDSHTIYRLLPGHPQLQLL